MLTIFTVLQIKDAYSLKFFENNMSRLPEWCNKEDDVKLPFCQIKGRYRMEFPGYNIIEPYPHMNEKCPSLPPNYIRPTNCWLTLMRKERIQRLSNAWSKIWSVLGDLLKKSNCWLLFYYQFMYVHWWTFVLIFLAFDSLLFVLL